MSRFEQENATAVRLAIEDEIEERNVKLKQMDKEEKEKKRALARSYVSTEIKKQLMDSYYEKKVVEESVDDFCEKQKEYEEGLQNYKEQKLILKEELSALEYWLSTKQTKTVNM